MNELSLFFRKHWQLMAFVLGLFVIVWLLWALRGVMLPFIVGLILAYLLLPFIRWIERRLIVKGKKYRKLKHTMRMLVIIMVYLLILAVIAVAVFFIITLVAQTLENVTGDAQQIVPRAVDALKKGLKSLPFLSDPGLQAKIDEFAAKIEAEAPGMLNNFLSGSIKTMQSALGTVFSFAITPVFMIFILKDWELLRRNFYNALPFWAREHTKNVFSILQEVLMRYIRGAMLQSLWVGVITFILLTVLRVDFALPLAMFAAVFEVVPSFGPIISGAVAVIVTLVMGDPTKIVWIILGYLLIQLIENNILVPRIQSSAMQMHPAFVLIISLIGSHFAGLIGFIIALPLALTVTKIFEYLRNSVRQGYLT